MTTWAAVLIFATIILVVLGSFLALLFHLIVTKRYWMTTTLLVVSVWLVAMLSFLCFSVTSRGKLRKPHLF